MHFKSKPKFIQRITATITALSITLSALSSTALAGVSGEGGGGTSATDAGNYIYGLDERADLSWKIDMYVSANPNGKIDVANDKIGSNKLPWVGAVMYDNFFSGSNVNKNQVWLSTDYTNTCRNTFSSGKVPVTDDSGNFIGEKWAVPNATHVYESDNKYTLSNKMTVGHYTDNPIKLPINAEAITDVATYKALVQSQIENNDHLSTILDHIAISKNGVGNFVDEIMNILKNSPTVINKLKSLPAEERMSALLPNSENCVVEWALVATPILGLRAASAKSSFWEVYDESNNYTILGNDIKRVTLGLDAYSTAVYNETSKILYKDKSYVEWLVNQGLDPARQNWQVYHVWSGTTRYYTTDGKITSEFLNTACNVAKAAYDMHEINPYCGVPVAGGKLDAFNNLANPAKFAQFGGITVYKNTIPDPGIPVYYYEYDPNTNKPTGKVFTETFQPNGNKNAEFKPSEAHGIPIAAESHKLNDKKTDTPCGVSVYLFLRS